MRVFLALFLTVLLALPAAARNGQDAASQWAVAETASFRVYGRGDTGRVSEHAVLLEEFRGLFTDGSGKSVRAPRLDLFLVPDMEKATPWQALPHGVAGMYRADSGRMSVIALDHAGAGAPDTAGVRRILLHEVAHHVMFSAGAGDLPPWYLEGYAEYVATAGFTARQVVLGAPVKAHAVWLSRRDWMPLEKLLAWESSGKSGADTAAFYAQSWLMVHHLMHSPAMRPKLHSYLEAVRAGEDRVEAFRRHVAKDFAAFNRALKHHARHGLESGRRTMPRAEPPPVVSVRLLGPAAEDLLMQMVALEHGVDPRWRTGVIDEIRRLASRHPDDPLARRTLALAELQHGSTDAAAASLEALLRDAPDDPDLLRWHALSLKPYAASAGPETVARARQLLEASVRAAPDDWRSLHALAWVQWVIWKHEQDHGAPQAGPVPHEMMMTLLKAQRLAPQVADIALESAMLLALAGRPDSAERLLAPLAVTAHSQKTSRLVSGLIRQIRTGDKAWLATHVEAVRKKLAREAVARRPVAVEQMAAPAADNPPQRGAR
ncbi:hypothetical protein ACUJ46_04710 [Sandaracinobacteroides sp. A072]|uniref:hypothetical protein n=1 Tax=Sandaracinobacteroides sp. A072 TaxID=3461146 RepID=UPI0040411E33